MKKFTKTTAVYLVLSIIGIAFAIYSIAVKNYILSVAAVLFAFVSIDNIFCNMK